VLIDGKGIGDVGRSVLKERRVLSEEGLVVVNMAFDEETGIVVYGPESSPGGLFSKPRPAICSRTPSASSWRSWRSQSGYAQPGGSDPQPYPDRPAAVLFFHHRARPVILPFLVEDLI
jgi:ribonuclease J